MRIVSRSGWGAAAPKSRTTIPTPVPRLWLHHTASTTDNGGRTVRAIQQFHMGTRGWADIAYSWLYSPKERLFYEGRGAGVAGSHTQGDNDRSHALCVLGNFDVQRPPGHVTHDLRAFLRWHDRYGPSKFTGGHRDAPGASTSCPGRHLQALIPTINSAPPSRKAPAVLLTRIDNSAAVYQVCGHQLIQLLSSGQAEAIAKLAGWSRWQDHVGNLTAREVKAAGFVLVQQA